MAKYGQEQENMTVVDLKRETRRGVDDRERASLLGNVLPITDIQVKVILVPNELGLDQFLVVARLNKRLIGMISLLLF